jgi:hypothetical protein
MLPALASEAVDHWDGKYLKVGNTVYGKEHHCLATTRNGYLCTREPDHKGHHSGKAWCCDGCGRHVTCEANGPRDCDGLLLAAFCFLCIRGLVKGQA